MGRVEQGALYRPIDSQDVMHLFAHGLYTLRYILRGRGRGRGRALACA